MATYACPSCGMSVNATCGECDAPLVNDTIQKDDGSSVQVSKCPNGHGKIKTPMFCGADMACSIARLRSGLGEISAPARGSGHVS